MANIEINCDECLGYKEGAHHESVKTICINCYNAVLKENKKLTRQLKKLQGEEGK